MCGARIPCSGTATDPDDCPAAVGSTAESTGGDVWNTKLNIMRCGLSGQDGGLTTDGTSLTSKDRLHGVLHSRTGA